MKNSKQAFILIAVFVLAINGFTGCAHHSKTVTTETAAPGQTVVVEETTTHTTQEKERGVLGGAFHVVGEILAFPFEVIAGVFRFIF